MEISTFLGPTSFFKAVFSTVLETYCVDGNVKVYAASENDKITISPLLHDIYYPFIMYKQ